MMLSLYFAALVLADIALLFIFIIKKNKVALYAFLTLSAILIGSVSYLTLTSVSETTVPTPVAVTTQVEKYNEDKQAITTRDTVYINSVYKFALAFPLNWGIVKEETKTGSIFDTIRLTAENDAARYIQIMVVKTKDTNEPSVKDYPQKFLLGSAAYTYYYSGGGDSAGKPGEEDQKYFDIQKEVTSISKSFTLTNRTTLAPEDMTGWKTVITYPTNGSVIEGRAVTIKGTARPNSYLWAFVTTEAPGDREADRACLSSGTGDKESDKQTDSNGNFEFTLDEPCSKNVWIYVASEDVSLGKVLYEQKNRWEGLCQSDSERISFTLAGELPATCK